MKFREYKDTTVVCRELTSGNHFPAKFEYKDDRILAEIYTWDQHHHFEDGQILLEDTNYKFISLHECLVHNARSSSRNRSYSKHIVDANYAVVGDSPWRIDERYTRITFKINEALKLFDNGSIDAEFIEKYRKGDYDSTFLELKLEDFTLSLSFACRGNIISKRDPEITGLTCEMEFVEKLELSDVHESIWCVTSFLSLCLGQSILPKDIQISRTDFKTWDEYLNKNSDESRQMSFHQMIWLDQNHNKSEIINSSLLYEVTTEIELEVFSSALEQWIKLLNTSWTSASRHMHQTLSLTRNNFDAERVLTAFRWLESIPTFYAEQVESDDAIEELTRATIEKAKELNINQKQDRLTQMLSKLKEESFKQQVERTLFDLSKKFPILNDMQSMCRHILYARTVRGKAAHDIINWEEKNKKNPFTSVKALEVFCTFLTLSELPRSERGECLIEQYSLVKNAINELR